MDDNPRRRISPERKATYYVGNGLALFGLLLFLSTFLSAALNFGNFNNFEARGRSMVLRSIIGMGLMIAGGVIANLGSRGLAGSGMLLDPEKAREDLEPWNRMAGGMTNDALSEVGVVKAFEKTLSKDDENSAPREVVKVRCRACNALNDEDAKFCDQCGGEL